MIDDDHIGPYNGHTNRGRAAVSDLLKTLDRAWEEDFKANLMHYCDLAGQEIRKLRKQLDELQSAETTYRMTYDLDGYHHQSTLEARGKLRTAGCQARELLAAVSRAGESGNG